MEPIPGLNEGGWHDAGDYDLRVESQIGTVKLLAMMMEEFNIALDATTIDHTNRIVEIHVPNVKNDVIQQIEHGMKTILGGYRSLNRLFRAITCPTIRQYILLGDGSSMTNNLVYDASLSSDEAKVGHSHKQDDRWEFTEENPRREQDVVAGLALCARMLTALIRPYLPGLKV